MWFLALLRGRSRFADRVCKYKCSPAFIFRSNAGVLSPPGFLLQTEIIPLCLRIMESGSELSKTVATFIVQKLLLDDSGLRYRLARPEIVFIVQNNLGRGEESSSSSRNC